jgi:hypothetical protein
LSKGSGKPPGPLGLGGFRLLRLFPAPPLGKQPLQVELRGQSVGLLPVLLGKRGRRRLGLPSQLGDAPSRGARLLGERSLGQGLGLPPDLLGAIAGPLGLPLLSDQ